MDPAILSATAALVGSLMGGFSTFCASWVTQRRQLKSHLLLEQSARRESLYAEFIMQATKHLTEAWGKQPEEPDVLAGLYAAMERMRLISSEVVIKTAEHVIRTVIKAYADPNRTFDDLRSGLIRGDIHLDSPLKEFTDACKAELHALPL
ncbi:MAG TPA: hypothetical protein VMF32_25855 [Xanthobacteraceae bacterium]|nr:hypothetical protein [Xanthobacteraceae bacterium]